MNKKPSTRPVALMGYAIIFVMFGVFGSWATVAKLDSAVFAPGTISLEGNRKVVQHLEGGIVAEILVEEADSVSQGDILIKLSDVEARSNLDVLTTRLDVAKVTEARLLAERELAGTIALPNDLRKADAIEIVVGQGAKPGGGGMLLGQKISDRVAQMRNLPKGIDQRSACRHPDWTGPDDLEIKILELREITGWKVPIYVKVAGARPYYDTTLAIKAGADAIVLDGMQGGTAATQDVFIEHVGQPTLAIVRPAVKALQDLGMHRKVQLILSGGIRTGADVAKAMALGADAVAIGTAALIALGDNDPKWEKDYNKLGTTSGAYDDWHEGQDPAGITTQDPELMKRFDPIEGGRRLRNYLKVMTLEAQTIARACGKNHLHNLEPEDLVALTMEAAAIAQVPLAGTDWWPGKSGSF